MNYFDVVESRQSIRKYAVTAVEAEKLERILHAANRAPSAGNFQSYEIYVLTNESQRRALVPVSMNQQFIAEAPVSLVFCANPARCQYPPPEQWALEDAVIACTFAMLAATDVGLSTCWIGAFEPAAVAKIIGAPQGITPVAMLCVGYAAEQPERTTRRAIGDIVHRV